MFLFVLPGATWDPWKNSASALNGHPRLKKNEKIKSKIKIPIKNINLFIVNLTLKLFPCYRC